MIKPWRVAFFIIAFLLFASSYAQVDSTYKYFDDMVIQGERIQIPFSKQNRDITVLNAKTIQSLPVQSVNEVLEYIAGIDIRQRSPWGGQADISINGGTFDQTLVLINGVKIIDPQTGHNMMNLPVSIDAIERIEIMKGAAASIYGINALSGVINIITKKPEKNEIIVNLGTGSSFDKDTSTQNIYNAINASVSASFVKEKAVHSVSLSSQKSTGFRYNTAMSNQKAFYKSDIELSKTSSLQFFGGFIYNDFGANAFYAAPGDIEAKETVKTGLAALIGSFSPIKKWQIKPKISYRYGFDDYIYNRHNPSFYQNIHRTDVVEASLNNVVNTKIGLFGLGAEYRFESINSNSLGDWHRINLGMYVNYSFSKINNLDVNAGAYLNYSKHFNLKLLPSIDIGYQINNGWRIFSNIGTGSRIPTYTDWYYKGPQNIGNSDLMPENAIHSEFGTRYNNKKNFRSSAIVFYHTTSDFIDWVKDSLSAPWQPQNFQTINVFGYNLAANYVLWDNKVSSKNKLSVDLSYTHLSPKIKSQNETQHLIFNYTLENLKEQFVLSLQNSFSEKYSVMMAGRYEQRVGSSDYFLLDARFSSSFKKFKVYLDFNNLLNITHIEAGAVPLPGRWISLGAQWRLN